jgi:hypothetical protein
VRQACRSTHSPKGTISPISSASGMKSAGETKPRSGWRQRSSASKPITMSPAGLGTVDQGLVVELELALAKRLAQVELEPARRLLHRASMAGSKKRNVPRPSPWPGRGRGRRS